MCDRGARYATLTCGFQQAVHLVRPDPGNVVTHQRAGANVVVRTVCISYPLHRVSARQHQDLKVHWRMSYSKMEPAPALNVHTYTN